MQLIVIVVQSLGHFWLCNPMHCSTPGSPVLHYLPEFAHISVRWVGDAHHLILCCPLLLLSSIFPRIRVFSNKLALHIRWPKYWSFSFIISPSNKYSGLISFRIDWFDLSVYMFTLIKLLKRGLNKVKILKNLLNYTQIC